MRTSVNTPNIPTNLQGPVNTNNVPRTIITYYNKTQHSFNQADYAQMFTAAGSHSLKNGAGIQRMTDDVNRAYPSSYVYIYWNSPLKNSDDQSNTRTYGYYRVDDLGTRGKVDANIVSLYLQDAWTIADRLTLNLGLRTENERI